MSVLLWLLGAFAVSMVASTLYRGARDRVRGRLGPLEQRPDGLALPSATGTLVFDAQQRRIWIERDGARVAHIAIDTVRGVQVRVGFEEARLEELFLEGMQWHDLRRDYRDHRMHWTVVLNTAHGPVRVAHLSQYKKRDWFDLATPLQHWALRSCGLYQDGADVAMRLETQVKTALRSMGLNVLGGYADLAPTGALEGVRVPTDVDLPNERPAIALPAASDDGLASWPLSGPGPEPARDRTDR